MMGATVNSKLLVIQAVPAVLALDGPLLGL
ncbi:putative membrane protein [Brevundimonas sp. SORGH_AS 993]|nr:putative membrane protein [Brevundimonas sp. SORGH_AS_0993]